MSKEANRLAIHGGPKARATPLPGRHAFGEAELAAVQEVFAYYQARGVDFGYQGHFEEQYCKAFVDHLGVGGYADAVATGTGSLFVALAALQLPKGSQVIVSPITDPGTINAIILNNLKFVLMDSMPGQYNAGPEQLRARLTPQTRAVVIVHSAGKAAPVEEMVAIAHQSGVKVLEDCSQSHGAKWHGKPIGTFGDLAAFSTMYRKNHATGGCGGVIFTRDENLYRLTRAHADRGKPFWQAGYNDKDPKQFLFPALNWNLDELSAAIGISTLGKLDEVNRRRREFLRALAGELQARGSSCTLLPIDDGDAEGISVNPHYDYVVSEWPYARPHCADSFSTPNAVAVRDASFNLLFNEKFTAAEARDLATAIVKVEAYFARA
jgi:dTDP-4-amino-4,6-dideoxygalactose transaminase